MRIQSCALIQSTAIGPTGSTGASAACCAGSTGHKWTHFPNKNNNIKFKFGFEFWFQIRRRYCAEPLPQFGGAGCQGESEQSRKCENQKPCPRTRKKITITFISYIWQYILFFKSTATGPTGALGPPAAWPAGWRGRALRWGGGTRWKTNIV